MIRKKISAVPNLFTVSKKQEQGLNFFWYGFAVYTIFYVLGAAEASFLSPANCQAIQILAFIMMVVGSVNTMRFKFDNQYLRILFIINLLYSATIVLRGSEFNKDAMKQMFLDVTFGILPYFASVVLLFPRNITTYRKIFNSLLILAASYLVCVVVFYNTLHDYDRLNLAAQGLVENISTLLALPIGYLLMNFVYQTGKKGLMRFGIKNMFGMFVIAVTLFFAIFRARRGLIFMCLTSLICMGMVYIITTKKKTLIIATGIILVLAGSFVVPNIKTPAMFGFLMDRGDEDTRSGVEVWMYADMSSTEWVIGKGIKGKYYCPIVDNVNDAEGAGYRDNIETGYLQIILKGGILSLGLLLLMFVPAVYFGLFKSRNVLAKASALWVLLWIVYLYPSGGIVFNMNYILVWISVAVCYSEKIRNLTDEEIKPYMLGNNPASQRK